jgi:alkylated DNA repair dioxygenase AlkB
MPEQFDIFGASRAPEAGGGPALPEEFRYQPELITGAEEDEVIANLQPLPFREFEFRGYTGKRRVISFGWRYDFGDRSLTEVDPIPKFLLPLRARAAAFAGVAAERLAHVLLTEYSPGSAIGWHKDRGVFGDVIGISLLSPCPFRLRRKAGARWERVTITAAPRSAYLLSGAARTEWEHSIPPVAALRYSITFRTLRDG